jgi:hypothetical protein
MVERTPQSGCCCHFQCGDSGPWGPETPAYKCGLSTDALPDSKVWLSSWAGIRPETFVSGRRFRFDILAAGDSGLPEGQTPVPDFLASQSLVAVRNPVVLLNSKVLAKLSFGHPFIIDSNSSRSGSALRSGSGSERTLSCGSEGHVAPPLPFG